MKKLFVTYKLANLAKEKGFDDLCIAFWHGDENHFSMAAPIRSFYNHPYEIGAPLHDQLIDWLYKNHKIAIGTEYYQGGDRLPCYAVLWHDVAYMEQRFAEKDKAIEFALNLVK